MIQDTNNEAMNIGAAVAEGVDTLPLYDAAYIHDGWQADASLYAKEADALTYGAQQREAGRREVDIRGLTERSDAWHAVCAVLDEVQPGWKWKQPEARNCMETAVATIRALARQPVSEGLPTNDEVYAEVCRQRGNKSFYVSTNAVNDVMTAVRALSAVPPAKAEGMTDAPTWEDVRHSLAILMCSLSNRALESCEHLLDDVAAERRSPISKVRAILAQQAKKGNQQ